MNLVIVAFDVFLIFSRGGVTPEWQNCLSTVLALASMYNTVS